MLYNPFGSSLKRLQEYFETTSEVLKTTSGMVYNPFGSSL